MPSGKVHSALTLATTSGVVAPYLLVQLGGDPWMYVGGCLVGLLVTPDLDINNDMYSHYLIRRAFYPAYWIWKTFWKPYSLIIPHRHFISHFPVVGTLLRIGYIFLIINLLSVISHLLFDTVSRFYWLWDWSFFFGLVHVDTIHFLVDNTIKGKEVLEHGNSR